MQSDGTVLVKTGARVNARVTRKEHTGLGRPGWLEVAFLSTQSTSGAPVRLDERPVRFEGESRLYMSKGGDVTLQAGSTFMPIGSILELPGLP